jgi:hypothetical protein
MTNAFTNILGALAALVLGSTVMLAATAPAIAPTASHIVTLA